MGKHFVGAFVAALATLPANAELAGNLIGEDGMENWARDTGDWVNVVDAFTDPDDAKLIKTKPGHGVIVNGPIGRTVNLFSEGQFGDIQITGEFMVPEGSNSGIYLMGRYEIQIFDSWGVENPEFSDCGGIYQRYDEAKGQGWEGKPPLVNASKAPGEWQTFRIKFRAPRFDEHGNKTENARFESVYLNDMLVQENVEVTGPTRAAAFHDEQPTGPLMLQGDHGPVAYRNLIASRGTNAGEPGS